MSLNCEIVRDLVAMYTEDALSEETKKFVDAHISSCEDCHSYYEDFKAVDDDLQISAEKEYLPAVKTPDYSLVAKRLKKRKQITNLVYSSAVIAAAGLTFVATKILLDKLDGKD